MAYFVPTLRARREAPSLTSRLRRGFYIVSAGGRLVHWLIQMCCVKTTTTPADCQSARRYAKSPWLRHTQRVVSVCGPNIIANKGLSTASPQSTTAAHQFCLTSPTLRRTAHSCTIRPLYSTGGYRSYLWLREITAHLKCRGGAPTESVNVRLSQ